MEQTDKGFLKRDLETICWLITPYLSINTYLIDLYKLAFLSLAKDITIKGAPFLCISSSKALAQSLGPSLGFISR